MHAGVHERRPDVDGPEKRRRPRRERLLRLTIAFVLAALVGTLIVVGEFARRTTNNLLHPRRTPVTTTPASVGLPYETVSFLSADGTPLRGWLVPGTNRAAIIMVHGLWSNREQGLEPAKWLHEAGYGALLFDLRASGESGGDTVTFGFREADDVIAAAAYLAQRGDIDAARIGVWGESLGAATALIAAGRSRVFAAVVADSAFTSVESMISTSFRKVTGMPAIPFAPLVTWLAMYETGLRPAEIAPLRAVGHISPTPVLFIHGSEDTLIPPQASQALFTAAGEPKELWLVEGLEHGAARGALQTEHQRRVLAFFDRYLRAPSVRSPRAGGRAATPAGSAQFAVAPRAGGLPQQVGAGSG